jgi:hypothetical protein
MSKVTSTFDGFVGHAGVPVRLHAGEEYDAEHPLVQAQPGLFSEPKDPPKRPSLTGRGKTAKDPADG